MNTDLKYMPVLRLRQWEQKALTQFYFGKHIYPCVEIIKEKESPTQTISKKSSKSPSKTIKTFEEYHIPILWNIHSERVFVDLPVHMKPEKGVQEDVVKFIRKVIANRKERSSHLIKLKPLGNKMIPVISTYSQITGESDTIKIQERELRGHFNSLAFRTFPLTFENDLRQIEAIAKPQDFLIVDLGDYVADPSDEDMLPIIYRLKEFKNCHISVIRSAMDHELRNVELEHGLRVFEADNRLLRTYKQLGAHSFGDYAGIKKDKVNDGRGKSPGFIIYNPIDNDFYGFRGSVNKDGKSNGELEDFENIIVPSVMECPIIDKMKAVSLPFLGPNNRGWKMLDMIHRKLDPASKSPAKFKLIAMEHYLHCIRTKIDAGDFN